MEKDKERRKVDDSSYEKTKKKDVLFSFCSGHEILQKSIFVQLTEFLIVSPVAHSYEYIPIDQTGGKTGLPENKPIIRELTLDGPVFV